MTKTIRYGGMVLLVTCAIFSGCHRSNDGTDETRSPAPEFEGKSLDGEMIRLSELQGKVVLVNFWATWCGPCRYEIPDLIKLHENFKEDDFVVLGISLDTQPESYVRVEAKRMGITYPVVVKGAIRGQEWGGLDVIPMSFLIDSNGRIVHRLRGYTPIDSLANLIRPLLTEAT